MPNKKPEQANLNYNPDPKNILEVRGLKKYFPLETNFLGKAKHYLKAVDDVSFDVPYGKTMGIVGESGCGKTTMGRLILRLHNITDGRVYFKGKDITEIKGKELRRIRPQIQVIFQDPYSSLSPRLTVGEIIGEGVMAHKLVEPKDYRGYVLGVMKKCGLKDIFFNRYPHEFSGGQRQRICIARALAMKPDFIVCDEPVSALDVSIQAQIINLLKDLQKESNLTYLFISHDLSVIEHISDIIGVMYLGSLVESGDKSHIFYNPLHPYTRALLSAVPVPDPNIKMNRIVLKGDIPSPANPPPGCKFHTRCPECLEKCKSVVPEFVEAEPGHYVACHLYTKGSAVKKAETIVQKPTEEILTENESLKTAKTSPEKPKLSTAAKKVSPRAKATDEKSETKTPKKSTAAKTATGKKSAKETSASRAKTTNDKASAVKANNPENKK